MPYYATDLGLKIKSYPKDRRSGASILRSLDWLSSVLSTTLPPLLNDICRLHSFSSSSDIMPQSCTFVLMVMIYDI